MRKSFEIESDCLDIVKRIKNIDEDYFVVYDLEKKKFQLHSRTQGEHSYCLTFPFEQLDERAYNLVLKTRVQNSDEIFKEINEENQKLKKTIAQQVLNDFKEKSYDSQRNN